MKQAALQFKPKAPRSTKALANDFDKRNLALAEEILTCPAKFGGSEALQVIWAKQVVERLSGRQVVR